MFDNSVKLCVFVGLAILCHKFLDAEATKTLLNSLIAIEFFVWLITASLSLIVFVFLSSIFSLCLRAVNIHLPHKVSFIYTSMNTFFNTLVPLKGGIVVRGLYLKRHHDIPWSKYFYSVFAAQVAQLGFILVLTVALYNSSPEMRDIVNVSLFEFKKRASSITGATTYLWSALLVSFALVATFFNALARKFVGKLWSGLKFWLAQPSLIFWLLLCIALLNLATCLRLWVSFSAAGHSLSFSQLAFIYCAIALGLSWNLTPGNIGVREAAIVSLSSLMGIDIQHSLLAAVVDRSSSLLVTGIVGGTTSYVVASQASEEKVVP